MEILKRLGFIIFGTHLYKSTTILTWFLQFTHRPFQYGTSLCFTTRSHHHVLCQGLVTMCHPIVIASPIMLHSDLHVPHHFLVTMCHHGFTTTHHATVLSPCVTSQFHYHMSCLSLITTCHALASSSCVNRDFITCHATVSSPPIKAPSHHHTSHPPARPLCGFSFLKSTVYLTRDGDGQWEKSFYIRNLSANENGSLLRMGWTPARGQCMYETCVYVCVFVHRWSLGEQCGGHVHDMIKAQLLMSVWCGKVQCASVWSGRDCIHCLVLCY